MMQNLVISFDVYKLRKSDKVELEKRCDFFAALNHITDKTQNNKTVEEFREIVTEMRSTKPIRDNIRKRLYPDI